VLPVPVMEILLYLLWAVFWLVVMWLPALIAEYRQHRYRRALDVGVVVSLFAGWWLWVALLVYALTGPADER